MEVNCQYVKHNSWELRIRLIISRNVSISIERPLLLVVIKHAHDDISSRGKTTKCNE